MKGGRQQHQRRDACMSLGETCFITNCLPLLWRSKADSMTCLATGELESNRVAPWLTRNINMNT